MKWQEYQDAVGELYNQMNEFGIVRKNIIIPDKVTGQSRQVDVWWEMQLGDHTFKVLIDAKKRKEKIDVKDVEEILMLADAVNADKAIIVTNNDWTEPAEKKANHAGLDLRILTIDKATDLIVDDKWFMCKVCKEDCVVLDNDGFLAIGGLVHWWLGGTCRTCNAVYVNCQGCGGKAIINHETTWKCICQLEWSVFENRIFADQIEDETDEESNEMPFKDENQLEIEFPE